MNELIPVSISSLLGIILPPAIAYVNAKVADKKKRYTIALATSIAAGILVMLATAFESVSQVIATVTATATVSQAVYVYYWEGKIKAKKSETADTQAS